LFADPDRLRQVFWNLLTNSIKFTPPGGRVTVTASWNDDELVVSVSDEGKGIAAEFLPHVFEAFRQGERSSAGGLGLGLTIVPRIQGRTRAGPSHGDSSMSSLARSTSVSVGVLAVVTLSASVYAQDAPKPFSMVTYYQCAQGDTDRADAIAKELIVPYLKTEQA